MAPKDDVREVLDCFRRSGVVGEELPSETYCVFKDNERKTYVIRNNESEHAEIGVIRFLNQDLNTICSPQKLFINWSPCSGCSEAILEFVESDERIELEIIYHGLYRQHDPDNREGLQRLENHERVTIRDFSAEDWTTLEQLLQGDV